MERKRVAAVAAGFSALAAGGFVLGGTDISPLSATETMTVLAATAEPPACEDWGVIIPTSSCFAAGIVRNVSLSNLQGAAQFCKWKDTNPGEWNRLMTYASDGQAPARIVTWFGNHIQNDLQAYFAAGGPPFSIKPNMASNICKTPLAPPVVAGVTPDQTQATVTVTP